MSTRTVSPADITDLVGVDLGETGPHHVSQARVDAFADATDDHQWIHVDAQRAADSPFGGTVAHGFLTLALIPAFLRELVTFTGFRTVINYGCDRVRFISPVPVGSDLRAGAVVDAVTEVDGGFQLRVTITIRVDGAERPACVAEALIRQLV